MVISYCIWVFSILTLLKISDFTEINKTVEANDGNIIHNSIRVNENISGSHADLIDEIVHQHNLTGIIVQENDTLVYQSINPGTQIPNNINNEYKTVMVTGNSSDKMNGTVEAGGSAEQTKPLNITDDIAGNDEMPTFVVYRQKLEKESKEKKEKADSIPSSPTMIVKDDNKLVKPQSDSTSSKTLARDSSDPVGTATPIAQDTKTSINVEKIDPKSGSGGSGSSADEKKSDPRTATLTKKLLKNNVAAKECGAKMLEVSKQMTNADHVLNSNKDEYLNVPCSLPEKWFVVETCEPVQIRSIQIANFEMFSSRPKTFKVFSSDRYPVKHWYNLGLFRADDEKGIQTFTISDSNMVKYIKFEMVDHYGNEHYCPLTFVRVLGNVVIDEMDEDSEDTQSTGDDDSLIDNFSDSKSNTDGILTKAKDMLVKMVNGIGGAKNSDNDQPTTSGTANSGENLDDDNKSGLLGTESPCYFIDFLTTELLANCESTISIFQRFLKWDTTTKVDGGLNHLEARIVAEPFPLQIRADYFTVFRSINGSRFEFTRLHRSFCNLTAVSSRDLCIHRPWLGLNMLFKCCPSPSLRLSRCGQPGLPNITSSAFSQQPLDTSTSPAATVEPPDLSGTGQPELMSVITASTTNGNENQVQPDNVQKVQQNESGRDVDSQSHIGWNITEDHQVPGKESRANRTMGSTVSKDTDGGEAGVSDGSATAASAGVGETATQSGGKFGGTDQMVPTGAGSNAWNQAFMRIKNMAKQLELNVSISMQYLEELSQNYKSQTERLKRAQTQTAEELAALEHTVLQHRQDARDAIARLSRQLQGLALKLRFGFSPATRRPPDPLNTSELRQEPPELPGLPELRCADLFAADELFTPSWADSPWFMVVLSVTISVICNLLVLTIFYARVRPRLVPASTATASNTEFDRAPLEFSFVEELSRTSPSRSCGDLSRTAILPPYPVVLPPRGVNLSFVESRMLSDDKLRRGSAQFQPHLGQLGPHFYTVLPNLNFVTPSKDRKKKRKK